MGKCVTSASMGSVHGEVCDLCKYGKCVTSGKCLCGKRG